MLLLLLFREEENRENVAESLSLKSHLVLLLFLRLQLICLFNDLVRIEIEIRRSDDVSRNGRGENQSVHHMTVGS